MNWEHRWAKGETHWDHGRASPPLAEFFATRPVSGRAIVPGCGSGHDVRLLARHGLEATGLDIAPSAIKTAEAHPRVGNETYLTADWLNLPDALHGQFDWVVEHTCLCALDPSLREAYAVAVTASLRRGGHYLAVIYSNPDSDEGPPFRTTSEDMEALFGHFELLAHWKPTVSYESRTGREAMRWYRKPVSLG